MTVEEAIQLVGRKILSEQPIRYSNDITFPPGTQFTLVEFREGPPAHLEILHPLMDSPMGYTGADFLHDFKSIPKAG